jgi:hypothetical protein
MSIRSGAQGLRQRNAPVYARDADLIEDTILHRADED